MLSSPNAKPHPETRKRTRAELTPAKSLTPQPTHKKRRGPILPQTPEDEREDERRLRKESCAICPGFKRLSRRDIRHKRVRDFSLKANPKLLAKMQAVFPHYTTDKRGIPVALCRNHWIDLNVHKPHLRKFSESFVASQDDKFRDAPPYREASHITPLSKAHTAFLTNPPLPLSNILNNLSDTSPHDVDTSPRASLKSLRSPPKGKPRGISKKTKSAANLQVKHVLKAGVESSLSGCQLSKYATSLRSQEEQGEHTVHVPAGPTAKKAQSRLNQVFWPDFVSKSTQLCPDNGAAQMCKDVVRFLYKTVYIRGRHPSHVAVLKFNLDGGRGSQKLMTQYIFSDDPVLRDNSTEEDRETYAKQNGGYKDTGVRHTLILGLMKGGKESFEVTQFFFNHLVESSALEKAFPNAEIRLPNDLKQQNLAAGVGPHSSRNPLHANLWSKFANHSAPHTVRTGKSIMEDLASRRHTERKGGDSSAKLFHSVGAGPINILKNRAEEPVGDILCPCPLHLNLGVAPHIVECAQKIDDPMCREWERKLGVKRDEKRGGKRTFKTLRIIQK